MVDGRRRAGRDIRADTLVSKGGGEDSRCEKGSRAK